MVSVIPLLAKEGWTRHQENVAKPPLMARTGWSLTSHVATIDSETWLVSDHPVCAASVATRLFLTGAATPSFPRRGLCRLRFFVNLFTPSMTARSAAVEKLPTENCSLGAQPTQQRDGAWARS